MNITATSRREEQAFQASWRPLERHKDNKTFAHLIDNEFRDPENIEASVARQVARMVAYAGDHVPFYRDAFAAAGIDHRRITSLADLSQLPVLSRFDLASGFDRLRSTQVSLQDRSLRIARTSGSSGVPVKVLKTRQSSDSFAVLWLRQARWFRHDLSRRYGRILTANTLYRRSGGALNLDGDTIGSPSWMYAGQFFHTGDEVQFNSSSSRPDQLRWLEQHQPAYLMSYPGLLEELALANGCQPLVGVEGLVAISTIMTRAMRTRVETSFGIPIYQNYGLNEAGLVAVQCAAGRYHTHIEHVHVEIVDADGQRVAPGASGRLLVTTITNPAMPLLRYDTGDIAIAATGPCPCGRTLPSFLDVIGRHRRFAETPEGTRPRVNGLIDQLAEMPPEWLANLRQYQIHQAADRSFELRVQVTGKLHEAFGRQLQQAWATLQSDGEDWPLTIVEVGEIQPSPGGKLLDFVSEFDRAGIDPAR